MRSAKIFYTVKLDSFLLMLAKWYFLSLTLLVLTACGSSSNSDNNNPQPTLQTLAIEKIADYAQNGGTEPSLQDYTDAGVTGVTASNLVTINTTVAGLSEADVDTQVEIQALADNLVIVIPNIAPTATADTIEAVENITITFDVLGNDTDVDGTLDKTSVTINTPVSNGSTSINPTTGEISYTPAADYSGADSFAYTVQDDDGLASNDVTVSITVDVDTDNDGTGNKQDLDDDGDGFSDLDEIAAATDPLDANSTPAVTPPTPIPPTPMVNNAPKANADSVNAVENQPITFDVLNNDTDADGSLNKTSVSINTPVSNGTTSINPSTGEITYTPTADYSGNDSLAYTVQDNKGLVSNEATVSILVDVDTDGNGIGNTQDLDDDGDGFSDIDELAAATDPLDPHSFPSTPPASGAAFKIKIKGDRFLINTVNLDGYNYSVDCDNDGVDDKSAQTKSTFCTYPTDEEHIISITGMFPRFVASGGRVASKNAEKLISVEQWGTGEWLSFASSFSGAVNLRDFNATDTPNLSKAKLMNATFSGATQFNGDISNWDVSNVTTMVEMFSSATNFNGDIGAWKVGKVASMRSMFYGASSFNQDISGWDVGSVKNMASMFARASLFNSNLAAWDVSNVENMSSMFSVLPSQPPFNGQSSFNQDISGWDVGKVKDMSFMFQNATKFNQNIGNWNEKVKNVTNMAAMFIGAIKFNQNIGGWNVSSVINMNRMFQSATEFNHGIGSWNVSAVSDMGHMFALASNFDQNLGGWNIGNVTKMSGMFDDVRLSVANYNSLLENWSKLTILKPNVILDCKKCLYSGFAASAAREFLTTDTDGPKWTIRDAGQNPIP